MTFATGKSIAELQVDSVREAFALQCGVSTAAVMFESELLDVSFVGLDSEEAASNYKHEGTSEDLPREFRRDWACCGGPRCCGVFRIFQCLCWSWSEHQ